MSKRKRAGSLTPEEKKIVKALIDKGMRLQDIQALINVDRIATVNSARLTEVKHSKNVLAASDDELSLFQRKKELYDPKTGLNPFDHERIIRAREAMILAVQLFNSPAHQFKTEVFSVLANIAWTYLLHEHYVQKKVKIVDKSGNALLLSQMLNRDDCPLSKGIKDNLWAIKEIRDAVEHQLFARTDAKWLALFQACCLNFDKTMCDLFGSKLTLTSDLGVALHFSKIGFSQSIELQKFEIPAHIEALDARLKANVPEPDRDNLEYQFRVIYTFDSASKSKAHIQFVHPNSPEAAEIKSVLVKYKSGDELYPLKPKSVASIVEIRSGQKFTTTDHAKAWRYFKTRPAKGSTKPQNTNKDHCLYHSAHGDYTYSDTWVDFLVTEIAKQGTLAKIRAVKQ